jgi:hypothetical protein
MLAFATDVGARKLTPESQVVPAAVRRLVAAGWLAHAVFDNVHDKGPTSRLPEEYPAACAGYDVALAGLLLRE